MNFFKVFFKIVNFCGNLNKKSDPSGTRTPNTLISRLSPVWDMFCEFFSDSPEYWTNSAILLVKLNIKNQ